MSKKLNWLDKFAEEQSKKMNKTASLNKVAEQIIVSPEDAPGAIDGQQIAYKDQMYKVLNASFEDEMGPGVVLEKVAEFEGGVLPEEMSMEMGAPTVTDTQKCTVAPEKAVQPDQGNNGLHIEVRDTTEVDKFNQEATETESQIAQENAVDRTTPEGKYNRIEQRLQSMSPVEEPAVDTETVMDAPVVEEPATEESVVEEEPAVEDDIEIADEDEVEVPEETVQCEDTCEDPNCECNQEEESEDESEDKQIVSNKILSRIFSANK